MDFKELSKALAKLQDLVDSDVVMSIDWSLVQDKKPCIQIDRDYLGALEQAYGTVAEMSDFGDNFYKLSINDGNVEWMCLQRLKKEGEDND